MKSEAGVWIFAERNSPSDEELIILRKFFSDGQQIRKGEVLFELEGAKAVFEIESPMDGYVYSTLDDEQITTVIGNRIAYISKVLITGLPEFELPRVDVDKNSSHSQNEKFTQKALDLIEKNSIDIETFQDQDFVTEKDVLRILDSATDYDFQSLKFIKSKNNQRIALVGGGNGALLAEFCLELTTQKIVGVFDDRQNKLELLGVEYFGDTSIANILKVFKNGNFDSALISITSNIKFREKIIDLFLKEAIPSPIMIHEDVKVPPNCQIGDGTLILNSVRIAPFSIIGSHVFASAFVNIEHHCVIGNNVTFGPGVFLSGAVHIGNNVVFGSNIAVEPGIRIGSNSIISSGSIITKDVPANTVVKNVSPVAFRSF